MLAKQSHTFHRAGYLRSVAPTVLLPNFRCDRASLHIASSTRAKNAIESRRRTISACFGIKVRLLPSHNR